MFYSNLYRRHLLDMHIEDWDDRFLSKFSPEVYVENLKIAEVNYAMVYLQSHVGLCYFPTKTGETHAAVKKQPDLLRRVVDLCHENGIRVCGYYSLIYNTKEHDKHPEWRMKNRDGKSLRESGMETTGLAFTNAKGSRYGHCCPNNPDYLAFTLKQVEEMVDYFDCDALFFDMPCWPHTCYCEHCRKAFGKEIPDTDTRELIEFKAKKMGEFVQKVSERVKMLRPGMVVEHNFACSVATKTTMGCVEEVLAACDYAGGDLYGDLYNHAFACKFFKNATKNPPFEQMFSRCKPALRIHTLTKTEDEMKTALASTMQHHGATLVIDAVDPIGTMDRRVYERIGEVFRFQKQYEPYFTGDMVEEVGLYYGMRSRLDRSGPTSVACCANAGKTLTRAHIPFGVTGSFHTLEPYKIIAAPMLSDMEDKDNGRLVDYVKNGGTLYLSGCGNASLVERLTGNRFLHMTKETNLYLAPKEGKEALFSGFTLDYPLPFEHSAPVVKPGNVEVLATVTLPYTGPDELKYAAIHSDPPGTPTDIPAVTFNHFGKGAVIWSAFPIECEKFEEYRKIFLRLLHLNGEPEYFFTSNAPRHVELTAFENIDHITLNAAVLDEEAESTEVAPFTVRVRAKAKSVRILPESKKIPFVTDGEYTEFETPVLHIFDMYKLET